MSLVDGPAFLCRRLCEADAEMSHALLLTAACTPGAPQWTFKQTAEEILIGHSIGLFMQAQIQAVLFMRRVSEVCEITYLATHPDYRRRGMMAFLLRTAINEEPALGTGPREIWLEVHESNAPARGLYEKLGFEETGRRTGYYRDGGAAVLFVLRTEL